MGNVTAKFIIRLGKKVISAGGLLNSTLKALIGQERYRNMINGISNVPMARSLYYFIFYLLSNGMVVWRKSDSLWLIRLPGGAKWLVPQCGDAVTHVTLIWRDGIFDKYEPQTGQVVVDAGAHCGIYTVKASKEIGAKGTVIAIEPHPTNFELLKKNLELNKCANVIPIEAALTSSCGEVPLFLSARTVAHSILKTSDKYIYVRATTLDQLVKDLALNGVDLLKADVEGATIDVLKGAKEVLRLHRPRIVADVGHYPTERDEVMHFLNNLNFFTQTSIRYIYAEPKVVSEKG